MYSVIRAGELPATASGSVRFEGKTHGSEISFFAIDFEPGYGPGLHRHPYSETWLIRSGTARFVAGDKEIDAGPGDVLVAEANVPHKFTATDQLEMICIHASPTMIQEELER